MKGNDKCPRCEHCGYSWTQQEMESRKWWCPEYDGLTDGTQVPISKVDNKLCPRCVEQSLYEVDGRCPIDGGSCYMSRETDYFWTAILMVVVFVCAMIIAGYLAWRW